MSWVRACPRVPYHGMLNVNLKMLARGIVLCTSNKDIVMRPKNLKCDTGMRPPVKVVSNRQTPVGLHRIMCRTSTWEFIEVLGCARFCRSRALRVADRVLRSRSATDLYITTVDKQRSIMSGIKFYSSSHVHQTSRMTNFPLSCVSLATFSPRRRFTELSPDVVPLFGC